MTRQGKPPARLVGVTKQEWKSVILQTDPQFWKLIHVRRKQPALPSYSNKDSRSRPQKTIRVECRSCRC